MLNFIIKFIGIYLINNKLIYFHGFLKKVSNHLNFKLNFLYLKLSYFK